MFRVVITCLWALLALPLYVSAEPDSLENDVDYFLETSYFSTIASGHLEAVRKAPGVVSVITADEIEAMGANHLDEVLEAIPGLHVLRSDLSRLEPVYSIRGIHSGFNPQVLILFNGMELKNPYSGGLPPSSRLAVGSIERIEVIKGASSALYGANAYSGVINIIPKGIGNYSSPIAQLRHGSFNSQDLTFQYSEQNDDGTGFFVSVEHQRSDGDRSRTISKDLQSEYDRLMGTSASLAPGPLNTRYNLTSILLNIEQEGWHWNHWFWHQDDVGTGQGVSRALDDTGYGGTVSYMSHLQFKKIVDYEESVESNLSYHFTHGTTFFNLFPDNSLIPIDNDGNPSLPPDNAVLFTDGVIGTPEYKSHNLYADTTYQFIGFNDHILRLNLGVRYIGITTEEKKNYGPGVLNGTENTVDGTLTDVTGQSNVYLDDKERHNLFIAFQDQWRLSQDWTLTVGGRWDDYSDFGDIFNPRLGLVWEPRPDFTAKLLYGEAFRAPSFSELYLKNNPSGLGTPSLEPETIKTYELVLDHQLTHDFRLINSFYAYKAEDLIENKLVGSVYKFQNSTEQDGYGFEMEAQWKASADLKLRAQYSYQHSENSETGADIANVPNHTAYLAADYFFGNDWKLHLNNHWIGSRGREAGDSRDRLKGYNWATMKLSKQFYDRSLQTSVIVKNLFDADARSPSSSIIPDDYPLESRSLWLELTYAF